MNVSSEASSTKTGYRDFVSVLLALAVVRIVLPLIPVPIPVASFIDFLLLIGVFVATIFAIYRAMSETPKPKLALVFLLFGVFLQLLAIFVLGPAVGQTGILAVSVGALRDSGLMIWCIGLGALIASLLREKNILIPVGMFLIAYDIFLVLAPKGFVQQSLKADPSVFQKMALSIPKTSTVAHSASSAITATAGYVGPADLVFLGAFFLAMFRFQMKPRETLLWMIPALIIYMIIVLVTGWNLPALVPIGLVTLLVNRKQFQLSKDEWMSTLVLGVIAAGVLGFLATRKPASPTEPSPSEVSSELRAPAGSPEQGDANQPQSPDQNAPQNKPGPR